MKKFSVLGLAVLMGASAMAQESVLKEAERAMKKDQSMVEVVKIITPAFSDPATAQLAQTYYIPGKAAFNEYDKLFTKAQLGQLDQAGKKTMVETLLGGYDYMIKAMPLDQVPDEKGKVKPKYTKDIINTIGGHYADFSNMGVEAYTALEDYNAAYELWNIYTSLPDNPDFASLKVFPNDTVLAEVLFNQALAAWQMEDLDKSLASFLKAKDKGYKKQQLFDYALAVARTAEKEPEVVALAKEAYALYGNENPDYIGLLINDCINRKAYNEAVTMIDQAIAANPTNSQYYVIKGILLETEEVGGNAREAFAKAVELDPTNAKALYNYGRSYYNEGLMIYEQAPADNAGFNKVFVENFKPVMLEAVKYLEQASDANPEDMDPLHLLENAYYMLNDDTNLKLTQSRLGK